MPQKLVFFFDVDNTLLDNDRVAADLRDFLEEHVGHERQERYWEIFNRLRQQVGYADYLGALQQYRAEYPRSMRVLGISHFLINYPFAERLFPGALDVIARAKQRGRAVILSDGDVVFQPLKLRRSGIYDAVDGHALIYVHKEQELDDVAERYPAEHYVFIDDKVRLLSAIKDAWGAKVTTVFPRQGHYAADASEVAKYPKPDLTIEHIGEMLQHFDEF